MIHFCKITLSSQSLRTKEQNFGECRKLYFCFEFLFLKMTGQLGKYYGLKNRTTDYYKKLWRFGRTLCYFMYCYKIGNK